MKRFSKSSFGLSHRRPRLPFIEALENRSVLSVCGVTCGLADGVLSVAGTAADDQIAIRYDANSASLSVVGRDNELIGQFPVADVRGLYINGLGGNDQVQVDSQIEQSLAATGQLHVHGATLPTSTPTLNPALANYGPVLSPTLAPTLASLVAGNSSISSPIGSTLTLTISGSADHSSHGSASSSITLDSHVHDSAIVGGVAASSMLSVGASQYHNHYATYGSGSAVVVSSTSSHYSSSPGEEGEGDSVLGGHDRHTATVSTNVAFSKLVAKPCTVSYSGGLLVTSVDGKRQCNCEQKQELAAEFARQIAGRDATAANGPLAALIECVPCQSGLLAGLPAELQSCSMPSMKAGLPLAIVDELHAGPLCPAKSAVQDSESAEAPWLENLKYVGLPLLAASVAMVPALWERRNDEEETDEATNTAVDWLFGRFNVELLLAR